MDWTYRPSLSTDAGWMAELRAQVMRPDLERLDRYDDRRSESVSLLPSNRVIRA